MSSIGPRTAEEPHNCVQTVRPKYLTRKYCGSINLNCDDRIGESSYGFFIFIRIASGVNGGGRSSRSFVCNKFKLANSSLRFEIPFELDE
jgi:hypothetical protein